MGITVVVVNVVGSEFQVSCECEDWWRHRDYPQTKQELMSRLQKSIGLQVVSVEPRYGGVLVTVQTSDRKGVRRYGVMLSRGSEGTWMCKHALRALDCQALMPEHRQKAIFVEEEEAVDLARRHEKSVVTTVNGFWVVGFGYDG